jgi:hypothetical protein
MRHLYRTAIVLGLLSCGAATQALATPLCQEDQGRCVDPAKPYTYGKKYVGHDEPSLLFYSNVPGSGNSNVYYVKLPTDPPTPPKQDGRGGTFNFQLHPAFWFGMAMCDTQSFPEYSNTCVPDSDSNIANNRDPDSKEYVGHHAGAAFMEMQFYPPGWVPWPPGNSCDATHWCAALNIDSYGFDPNTSLANNSTCLSTVGIETVNFAFITYSGVPHAPPNPVDSTSGTFTPNAATDLFMSSGDVLRVTMRDTPNGFQVIIEDLTTKQSGSMTASAANGFGQVKFDPSGSSCQNIPYTFHPMYATSSAQTTVPWAAHTYNVAFSDEVGHFEYCNAVSGEGGVCTSPGVSDAGGLDGDDSICFDGRASTFWNITGCINADLDFDGPTYVPDWPGTLANVAMDQSLHAAPIAFTSPLFTSAHSGRHENYSAVAFEADLPSFEPFPQCNPNAPGAPGCTNPPPGAAFYPLFTTAQAADTCVWHLGGALLPGTTNTFGGTSTAQFGPPELVYYPAPFGYTGFYSDFHNNLNHNPCPNTRERGEE